MRYTIYLNVLLPKDNNCKLDVFMFSYKTDAGVVMFSLDEHNEKTGFFKADDVKYVLPIELK